MAFVALGGDDATRPTFFETLAAGQLVPSLRAAIVYTLSVFSQRHSWLHRVLDYEDEVLAGAMLLLDWHSLNTSGATFAESLYGLRRRRIRVGPAPASSDPGQDAMTPEQRRLSLALEVLIPYIKSKAQGQYTRLSAQLNQGVLGLAVQRGITLQAATPLSALQDAPMSTRLRHLAAKAYVSAYPWLHAASELTSFAYHTAYLLGVAPCHRPALHLLGLQLARVSAQDMAHANQHRDLARRAAVVATMRPGRPPWLGSMQRGWLRLLYLVSDNARHALILLVFGFKGLEWWFNTAEERLAAGKALPTPPPPPPPRPSPQGVGLPEDPSCCPVCKHTLVNPAQVSTSGYVGCYTCVYEYVRDQQCCPVTQIPCDLDHIRKLYDTE